MSVGVAILGIFLSFVLHNGMPELDEMILSIILGVLIEIYKLLKAALHKKM